MTYQLGVDIGTTTVAAAIRRNGHAEMIALGDVAPEMPTALFRRYDGSFLAGEAAEDAAREEPGRGVRDFLRQLDDPLPLMVGGAPFTRTELVAEILGHVRTRAVQRQGGAPTEVVLTHPATWAPHQVASLVASAEVAGFVGVRTIDRLEATARHHVARRLGDVMQPLGEDVFAVYLLGGTTFEVGLFRWNGKDLERRGQPQGIDHLGGVRFDQAVYSLASASLDGAMDILDPAHPATAGFIAEFHARCVAAKERLSSTATTPIHVLLGELSTVVSLDRPEFETLIRPLLSQSMDMVRRAAISADLPTKDLVAIVAAGGSSSIPLVAQMLDMEFGRPVVLDDEPAHVTALGAVAAMSPPATAEAPEAMSGTGNPLGGIAVTAPAAQRSAPLPDFVFDTLIAVEFDPDGADVPGADVPGADVPGADVPGADQAVAALPDVGTADTEPPPVEEPEPAQSVPTEPESAEAEPAEAESTEAEPAQSELAQAELTEAEPAEAESAEAESTDTESAEADVDPWAVALLNLDLSVLDSSSALDQASETPEGVGPRDISDSFQFDSMQLDVVNFDDTGTTATFVDQPDRDNPDLDRAGAFDAETFEADPFAAVDFNAGDFNTGDFKPGELDFDAVDFDAPNFDAGDLGKADVGATDGAKTQLAERSDSDLDWTELPPEPADGNSAPKVAPYLGPPAPSRAQRPLVVVAVASLMLAAVIAATWASSRTEAPKASPTIKAFTPIMLSSGVLVTRTWLLSGEEGDSLRGEVTLTNKSPAPVDETFDEVIPKSVATSASQLTFRPTVDKVVREDPVVRYNIKALPTNNRFGFSYTVALQPEGNTQQRLNDLAADQVSEETAYKGSPVATLAGLTVNPEALTLTPGQVSILNLAGQLTDGQQAPPEILSAVAWSSSDINVATVDRGTVTGIGPGAATVTAQLGEFSRVVTVEVRLPTPAPAPVTTRRPPATRPTTTQPPTTEPPTTEPPITEPTTTLPPITFPTTTEPPPTTTIKPPRTTTTEPEPTTTTEPEPFPTTTQIPTTTQRRTTTTDPPPTTTCTTKPDKPDKCI